MRWLLLLASVIAGALAIVWMVIPEVALAVLGPDLFWGHGNWGTVDGKYAVFSASALGHAFFVRLIGCGIASISSAGLLLWSFRCQHTTHEPSP